MKTHPLLLVALLASLAASPATAVTINLSTPTGGGWGLDQGYGCLHGAPGGCTDTFNDIYTLAVAAPGTGTLDVAALAAGNTTADLSVTVPSSLFSQVAPAPSTLVTFSNTSYTASAVPVLVSSSGAQWSITQFGAATATAAGTHTDTPLTGVPIAFNDAAGLSSLNCLVDKLTLQGQCGFTVGGLLDFTLPIGPGSTAVDFVHTFNLLTTPEPSTAVLVVLGFAGIGLTGRRRI
ncbi:MAG TPA: PEP-CTERM sorting domain-containing protein [Myxococcota bacterium]|nr:PEP-CTERM sorting domain-containing protein [Myxococcota bacterium]